MKTAVIYARFSCTKQREASIEDQLKACSDYCAREGIEVVNIYTDYAFSGTNDNRPNFQRMIENAPESDYIVVYMMERFSRGKYDPAIYKSRLEKVGVRVISALEYIPDTPEGILIEKNLEAYAAYYSLDLARKTKRGMRHNALDCQYNGDRVYGYSVDPETKRYIIDERQAEVVRECFARRAQGESVNAIARSLAARGVKTYRGKPCSHTMVSNMLKNRKYIGIYKWGDVEVEGGMPAIITLEEWNMAHNAPQSKKRKLEEWDDYVFTGKAVCGECGYNIVGRSGRGANGEKYCYYTCRKQCGNVKPVPKQWLENHVAEALRELVSDRELALQIGHIVERYNNNSNLKHDRERAEAAIKEADAGLKRLLDAIVNGISIDGMKDKIAELEAAKKSAQEYLDTHQELSFDAELFADFLQHASTLSDEKIIDMLVWQVVIQNDQIIVALNYEIEPGIPQRFIVDGFSQFDKRGKKSANSPGQDEFAQFVSGSPIVYLYETNSGFTMALRNERLAVVFRRAA